jgi:hypothetical protein
MSSHYQGNTKKRDPGVDNFSVASIAESQTKTHNEISSPYGRIFRKSNIYASMIPNFLKQQEPVRGITVDDLRRLEIQSQPKFDLDICEINSERFQAKFTSLIEEIRRTYFLPETNPRDVEQVHSMLNEIVRRNYSQIRLSIKKWEITGEELYKLLNNRDINVKIINAFMQHLKQFNRFLIKKSRTSSKFNFISVELAELILIKGGLKKIPNLGLNTFDFHIFPIFHHYWKLVVYATAEGSIKVYDLGRNCSDRVMYKENLENFVKFNEHNLESIRVEEIPKKGINLWNSGLYLCKMAQNLINRTEDLHTSEDISEFRIEILVVLLRLSQINFIKT